MIALQPELSSWKITSSPSEFLFALNLFPNVEDKWLFGGERSEQDASDVIRGKIELNYARISHRFRQSCPWWVWRWTRGWIGVPRGLPQVTEYSDRPETSHAFFDDESREMMTFMTDTVPYAYEAVTRSAYDGYRHHLHHHHHHHHPHRYRRVYTPTEPEYLQGYVTRRDDIDDRARIISANNVLASAGSLNYRNDRVRWAFHPDYTFSIV